MTNESAQEWWNYLSAVLPALTGGLIALSGTIALFWLQQRAQRKAEAARRVEEAFDRYMSFCGYVARQLSGQSDTKFSRWDVYDKGWRFTWTLPQKDRAVGEWAMRIVIGSVEGFNGDAGEAAGNTDGDGAAKTREWRRERLAWAEENLNLAVTFLDKWKQGKIKTKWFQDQLTKAGFDSPKPPTLPSEST
ncbi:hypothetical protein FVA74_12640 [Salinibacterium sp. dk2585]|uniref:hypothetical protein n=1 Tax=unclassified Salinibacterium TaxID=2632331 RepID=UPI0011C24587|nr:MULTISPECIES: hypothetical protein [unclassified Salinibacterium]QEE62329.1 hypothetical protein FVA74_12640 [Salinibacterium sp. dk2585]TXK53680.1 hypothetical protein FVP63_10905 [Salinibacterium sp. dk5596]